MTKIKVEELDLIIAEIEQLSRQKEAMIERQQLVEILTDLNLPLELLDEALLTIEKKKTLAKQRQKTILISSFVGVILISVVSSLFIQNQQYQKALMQMNAIDSRITLEEDNKNNLEVINRRNSPRLHFRVTFQNTPVGKPLSLGCDWINPQGQIVHQNRYQTSTVEKEIWNTRCRYVIGNTSPLGVWQVKMFSGDRLLREQTFQVEEK